jgi:hypothetical protein
VSDRCPTEGFSCVNRMRARVQALTDQIEGFSLFLEATKLQATPQMMVDHYRKVSELLQSALDEYTKDHGHIPVMDDVDAVRWVLGELKR